MVKQLEIMVIGFTNILKKIKKIYLNGKTAEKYYIKYIKQSVSTAYACLPSTSPANAAYSFEDLISAWSGILK